MRTLYKQHMIKVIISLELIVETFFGAFQLFFNEEISKKYVPQNTAISSAIETVQKEKNDFINQINSIENGINNSFNF